MRSPTRTPAAVPGIMTRRTSSEGNSNTPMSRLDRMTSWVRLSRARPKKAFQSPGAYHRATAVGSTTLAGIFRSPIGFPGALGRPLDRQGGAPRARPSAGGPFRGAPPTPLGGSLRADACPGQLTGEGPHPARQRRAPGEVAAVPGDLVIGQLDGRCPARRVQRLAEPEPHAVALALPPSPGLHDRLHAGIFPLRVRAHEVSEPAGHLVVVTPGEHRTPLSVVDQHSLKPHDRHFLQPSS